MAFHSKPRFPRHATENWLHLHPGTGGDCHAREEHDGSQIVLWESTLKRITVHEAHGQAKIVEDLGRKDSVWERTTRQHIWEPTQLYFITTQMYYMTTTRLSRSHQAKKI
ncbi:hypothetical protein KC19_VG269400 [Ceratodon purpureus]|uniref:Uncharacterized protein n=1 Tax=Ceratodon purpureus TaxID=3225 RepID=A0A8T0HU12_CERPU|nr:hypothetical protein KC19_VG268400 [Ceratodon purpureus]KAG0574532.1 hypothetical protein KC19_VG269400 [Ceratodon purpureus]